MSLIADSLKRALKENSPERESRPAISLFRQENAQDPTKTATALRVLFLIVLPGIVLGYFIYTGVFEERGAKVTELPVLGEAESIPQEKPAPPVIPETPSVDRPRVTSSIEAVEKKPSPPIPKVSEPEMETAVAPAKKILPKPVPPPKTAFKSLPPQSMEAIPGEAELKTEAEPVGERKAIAPAAKILRKPVPLPKTAFKSPSPVNMKDRPKPLPEISGSALKPPGKSKSRIEKVLPGDSLEHQTILIPIPQVPKEEKQRLSLRTSRDRGPESAAQSIREKDPFKGGDYFFNRAVFYQKSQEWSKALENYSKAAELEPANPDTYNNRGVIYKEQGKFEQALEEFLRAVYLDPDYAKAYNNIGVVYYLTENYAGAIRNYRKAIEIRPRDLDAFNNLAIVHKKQNQRGKARSVLNRALAIDPDHPATHYNLAVLYEEEGNAKSAQYFYLRFVKLGEADHPSLVMEVMEHLKTLK